MVTDWEQGEGGIVREAEFIFEDLVWSPLCGGATQISVIGIVGQALGRVLNDWENYQTKSAYMYALAWKIFLFEFSNHFNVYIYIAFIKGHLEGCLEVRLHPLESRVATLCATALGARALVLHLRLHNEFVQHVHVDRFDGNPQNGWIFQ